MLRSNLEEHNSKNNTLHTQQLLQNNQLLLQRHMNSNQQLQDKLFATQKELTETKSKLTESQNDLQATKTVLVETQNVLKATRRRFDQSNTDFPAKRIKNNVWHSQTYKNCKK